MTVEGEESLNKEAHDKLEKAFDDRYPVGRRYVKTEILAMVIAQLPKLQYLSIEDCAQWPSGGISASAFAAMGISHLPIRTLDCGPNSNSIIDLSTGLETLNLHDRSMNTMTPLPRFRTLRTTEGNLSGHGLRELLSACTDSLETFAYEAGEETS
ncbi:hypothetical protein FZEAL_8876 [Fusarium zealandicum]|uniref:Uncharacterized protein n=1 Tax=Fusarium zealandicum TaxID=1053134 RepID=A0A8H4UDF9_9HYPO|nr:hypothetical protein FZEAL_8876 [Fusarium zealandicum]